MSHLKPDIIGYFVDKEHYGKTVDPTNPLHLKEGIMNGHITLMMEEYTRRRLTGKGLWEMFHDDFEEFNLEALAVAHRNALKALRDFLLKNGVWVRSYRGTSVARVIYECLQEEEPHAWDDERRAEVQNLLTNVGTIQQPTPITPITPHTGGTPAPIQTPENQPYLRQPSPYVDGRNEQGTFPFQRDHQNTYTREELLDRFNARSQEPQDPLQTTNNAKLLTDLAKLYTDEKRYGGELYDVLDSKLRIFQDSCRKVGITKAQCADAFSIMLRGRAATYYYDKLADGGYDFVQMVRSIRNHFETDEMKQQYLTEWRETTLSRIIMENSSLSKLECLDKLLDKLRTIQRGLDPSYHSDTSLRDQTINACRGIPECNLALFNPAKTYEGVCAQLRSAIGTAIRSREAQQFTNATQHHDDWLEPPTTSHQHDFHDQHWTDRTYGGRRNARGGVRGGGTQSARGPGYIPRRTIPWKPGLPPKEVLRL
jgi:hypothetical protein